jgi:hypothetical protein
MTQVKKSKVSLTHETELTNHEGLNLRDRFQKLSAKDQQALAHFFNLHNAAIFIFQSLAPEAVEYAELCMKLSQEQEELSE